MDEGVVKYSCEWIAAPALPASTLAGIREWRERCYRAELIGEYQDVGIGYGNISIRYGDHFIISGTQTGNVPDLGPEGYTEVTEADIAGNSLVCRGPVAASSESLTHAMLYRLSPDIQAVIHVHNADMWHRMLHNVPTTGAAIPYGTPEMAGEIERLWNETDLPKQCVLAMAGHEDGIIAFGRTLEQAGKELGL